MRRGWSGRWPRQGVGALALVRGGGGGEGRAGVGVEAEPRRRVRGGGGRQVGVREIPRGRLWQGRRRGRGRGGGSGGGGGAEGEEALPAIRRRLLRRRLLAGVHLGDWDCGGLARARFRDASGCYVLPLAGPGNCRWLCFRVQTFRKERTLRLRICRPGNTGSRRFKKFRKEDTERKNRLPN